jgi:hypothetical protein
MTFTDTMPRWRPRWPRVIPTRDGAELPTPDAAPVDVHEIRSRIAHTAPMQPQRRHNYSTGFQASSGSNAVMALAASVVFSPRFFSNTTPS